MKNCIICHKPTEGSVGAAGIAWDCICQPCKDAEDAAARARLKDLASGWKKLFSILPLVLALVSTGCAAWERPVVYRQAQFPSRLDYLRFCDHYQLGNGRCVD